MIYCDCKTSYYEDEESYNEDLYDTYIDSYTDSYENIPDTFEVLCCQYWNKRSGRCSLLLVM